MSFINHHVTIFFVFRMNHPIKRFKSDNEQHKIKSKNLDLNLYAEQDEFNLSNSFQNKPNFLGKEIKSEVEGLWKNCEEQQKINSNRIKDDKSEIDDKISTDNLFTSEGLQPSYADLNKIFDNSDDNSNDDHVRNLKCCRIMQLLFFFIYIFSLLTILHRDLTNQLDAIQI